MNLKRLLIDSTDSVSEVLAYYAALLVLATESFAYFEGKGIWDSLWLSCVTSLTIGYGDLYPVTVGGRITAIALGFSSVFVIAPLIVYHLLKGMMDDKDAFTHAEQESIMRDLAAIREELSGRPRV